MEFQLITKYFNQQSLKHAETKLAIGDDCAVITPIANQSLAITMDTFTAGIHFPEDTRAAAIGHKALAINLSDLAAMGATPKWFTLAITLPEVNEDWLQQFCEGMFDVATKENIQLIGGDTTKSPILSITIQAMGTLNNNQALKRSGAKPGDLVYVSNTIGDAGLALQALHNNIEIEKSDLIILQQALDKPIPRITLGQKLIGLATSCIDISDGFAQDLEHILQASNVGANIYLDKIPTSNLFNRYTNSKQKSLALTTGDDYELCFTVSAIHEKQLQHISKELQLNLSCIGEIIEDQTLHIFDTHHQDVSLSNKGYQHF